MVGTTGFEPATSRTPSVRATRLRHVPTVAEASCRRTRKHIPRPTGSKNSVSPRFEKGQGGEELFAKIEQVFALRAGEFMVALARRGRWSHGLNAWVGDSTLLCQMTTRSGDCEAFIVEQALDFEDGFDVFAAVHAVPT